MAAASGHCVWPGRSAANWLANVAGEAPVVHAAGGERCTVSRTQTAPLDLNVTRALRPVAIRTRLALCSWLLRSHT